MLKPDGIRVIHVIGGLYPEHGGPSYTVPRLCAALAEAGGEVAVKAIGKIALHGEEAAVLRAASRSKARQSGRQFAIPIGIGNGAGERARAPVLRPAARRASLTCAETI